MQCLEITILLSLFCSWGIEAQIKAEFVTKANHQKSVLNGSELRVICGHSLQHKLASVTQVEKLATDQRSSGHSACAITSCVCKYKEIEV